MSLRLRLALALLAAVIALSAAPARAQSAASPNDKPYVVEYYYKTQWGHADEFLRLFKKNHLPILRKEIANGRILSVKMDAPRLHASEDSRWDYRVTITFKNLAAYGDDSGSEKITKELYPDQATFKKEEQRRFEILVSHTDVPVKEVDLDAK